MIGKYQARLDDKNRLFVPAKLRADLGQTFYVTIGVNCGHKCLTAYTAEGWQTLTEKYDALPLAQKAGATGLLFIFAVEFSRPCKLCFWRKYQIWFGIQCG